MNAIILAAGKSTRLRPLLDGDPKPLIPLADGTPLIEATIGSLADLDPIEEIAVVTGYRHDAMTQALGGLELPAELRFVHNREYDTLGPIPSLHQGLTGSESEELLLMNGDTFYRPRLLARLVEATAGGLGLAASPIEVFEDDDVRVAVGEDGTIRQVGKQLTAGEASLRSAGLLAIRGTSACKAFTSTVADLAERERKGGSRRIWHSTLNELVSEVPIQPVRVPDDDWFEIDTPEDYETFFDTFDKEIQ